jgi:hypothetical protein
MPSRTSKDASDLFIVTIAMCRLLATAANSANSALWLSQNLID